MDIVKVFELFEKKRDMLEEILSWTTYEKFLAHAQLYLSKQAYKLKDITSDKSVAECLVDAAKIGVYIDGRNAHLLTQKVKDRQGRVTAVVCQMRIDYKGMRTIAKRHLKIVDIYAEVVRSGDRFEYQLGDNPSIVHVPFLSSEPGELEYCYAVAKLPNGALLREVMASWEIEEVKKKADTSSSYSPWRAFEAQMWKKSVLRRLCDKLLDDVDSIEFETALAIDNQGYDLDRQSNNPLDELTDKQLEKQAVQIAEERHAEAVNRFNKNDAITDDHFDEIPGEFNRPKLENLMKKIADSEIDDYKLDKWLEEPPGEGAEAKDLQPQVMPFGKPIKPAKTALTTVMRGVLSENDVNHKHAEKFAQAVKKHKKNNNTINYKVSYEAICKDLKVQELSELSEPEINNLL